VVGNNHAVLRVVDWLETIMLYWGWWSGWKQSCRTEGRGGVENNYAVVRFVEWLETIMLYLGSWSGWKQ